MLQGAAANCPGFHTDLLDGRVSQMNKSPERGANEAKQTMLLADHSSIRRPCDSSLCRTARVYRCLDGRGPLFNSVFFAIFPEGRLTRPPEIRRCRAIFSSNNGLNLKPATLLKNALKIFGITSFISLKSVPFSPPQYIFCASRNSVIGTRETPMSKVRGFQASRKTAHEA